MNLFALRSITVLILISSIIWISSTNKQNLYNEFYKSSIDTFIINQEILLKDISHLNVDAPKIKQNLIQRISILRIQLKKIDFWLRYLEPLAYKKINGPLPVEWETEVFEKFEKPYKREGAGLTLAELYLGEETVRSDSLLFLLKASLESSRIYLNDSITTNLSSHHHLFLANRLFLLNLSTIYTTGFECPEKKNIIPELKEMLNQTSRIYSAYNLSFPEFPITENYFSLFSKMISFVESQSIDPEKFNHFIFIRDFINPLFALNQSFIKSYSVKSISYNDYSLNDDVMSIYDKKLFAGQNVFGVYRSITDSLILEEVQGLGKLFFYDPILSGNNKRSCASCHKPKEYFTDTAVVTSLQFDQLTRLDRNTPSLINVEFNHLVMLDGKHFNLGNQVKDVLVNPLELNNREQELLDKVLSCKEYKTKLKKFAKLSTEKEIGLKHITSAIILYYSKFSYFNSTFDDAMNQITILDSTSINGFNLFMSKAQCATCHFAPQFNGVKPPYIGSEFEVIGVPATNKFDKLSSDKGRYLINSVSETMNAFRTGTIRNVLHTKPYMHNGVFNNLDEVIDFYNTGGGIGKGLKIENQTLSQDSLNLSKPEKLALLKFMESLDEKIIFEDPPNSLPLSSRKKLNSRKIGGEY